MREGSEEGFETGDGRWILSALEICRRSISLQALAFVDQIILQGRAGACAFDSSGAQIPDTLSAP